MKLLVTLEVPSISQNFEILVPNFLKVRELVPLFIKIARELSGNLYKTSGAEFICSSVEDTILDSNSTLEEYNIKNGDHLIML